MKQQSWMIFRTESSFVHYLWAGEYPILCYLPKDLDASVFYWTGIPANDILQSEVLQLNNVAENPRKRIFTLATRTQQRFVVVARGIFEEE